MIDWDFDWIKSGDSIGETSVLGGLSEYADCSLKWMQHVILNLWWRWHELPVPDVVFARPLSVRWT